MKHQMFAFPFLQITERKVISLDANFSSKMNFPLIIIRNQI